MVEQTVGAQASETTELKSLEPQSVLRINDFGNSFGEHGRFRLRGITRAK